MSASPEPSDDAKTRVRALLDEWVKRDPRHPVPDFAQKITIGAISDKTAYAGFLRCLFDVRTAPVEKMLAYRESAPPKIADKNDLWGLPSGLSRHFLEQEATIVAAETGEPIACNRCAGEGQAESCADCRGSKTAPCAACSHRGRKSCQACKGHGSIACVQCAGTGKVLLSLATDGMRNEDVCPQCTGKKELPCHDCADATAPDCTVCANKRVVTCPTCAGRGAALCAQCGGSLRVTRGFSVSIAYKLAYYRSLVRDPSIPEEVFPEDPASGKLGETALECDGEDAAAFAGKKPEGPAGDAFARVMAQVPAAGLGANSKLILQSLSIERIPIYEFAYTFEGHEYHAWATRFENRVVLLDDPFADLALRLTDTAESLLKKNEFALFEEQAAKAAALAPRNPAIATLRGKAGALQRRASIAFGAKVAGGLAVAVPALLAFLYSSPNRFAPLAALGLGVLGASLAAVFRLGAVLAARPLLPPSRRNAWAAGAAAGGAALAVALFVLVGPISRIDVREFAGKVSRYESLSFANWTPDDAAALTALDKDYAARGVDTAAGQRLLDGYASFVAAAQAQALLEEQARQLAKQKAARAARLKAEEARKEAAIEKALAAKRLAAKKAAALAAAKKGKSKKSKKKKKPTTSISMP